MLGVVFGQKLVLGTERSITGTEQKRKDIKNLLEVGEIGVPI